MVRWRENQICELPHIGYLDLIRFSERYIETLDIRYDSTRNRRVPCSVTILVSLGRLVLEPLRPKAASVGKSVTFLCALAEGRTGKFSWTKDGILLHEQDRIQVANLRRTSTLNIEDVETSDRGLYTCTVNDADSEDRQSAVLSVEGMTSHMVRYGQLGKAGWVL